MKYLSYDEAFETAQSVFPGEPFGKPMLHMVNGSGTVSEPDDSDHIGRPVSLPVTVESYSVALSFGTIRARIGSPTSRVMRSAGAA